MEQWDNERVEVLKRQNQVLRRMNRNLRSALKSAMDYNDHLFIELCNSYVEAHIPEGSENQVY